MQFGLSISAMVQVPRGGDMAQRLQEIITLVRRARELGFHCVYTGQHYLSSPYQELQPVPLLARLAAESGPMRLATTLLFPLHHPVELAEHLATLDIITGGKLTITAAIGYREEEYAAFGVQRKERVRRTLECLELVIKLWTEESVTYHGRHFHLDSATMTTRPLQKPHPPIWLAANSDAAVERAARMGLIWHINPHATYDTIARQVELYRRIARAAGHPADVPLPINRELYCALTREQALGDAQPYLGSKYQAYARWGQEKALPGKEDFTAAFDQLAQGRFIIGSPDQCVEQLERYRKLGIGLVNLRMSWPGMPLELTLKSMELVAKEVIPGLPHP